LITAGSFFASAAILTLYVTQAYRRVTSTRRGYVIRRRPQEPSAPIAGIHAVAQELR
jgi:hypothetical protein